MERQYLVLLRAISNVPMQPFRSKLEELGFNDVESYGMSGNLIFNVSSAADEREIRVAIEKQLGTAAFVRTRTELARIVSANPYRERSDAAIMFLAHPPATSRRRSLSELDFETDPPVIYGRSVFFRFPVRLRGKRTPLDLERVLGIPGTSRSAKVVNQLLSRMKGGPAPNRKE